MGTDLVQHAFNGQAVRVITDEHGEPLFVLADVCRILDLGNPSMVAQRIDPDALSTTEVIDSMGRRQRAHVVTEAGLYEVVFLSRKPEAREFRRWVTTDVLPSIRRTGSYGVAALTGPELLAHAVIEADRMIKAQSEQIAQLEPPARAWEAMADAAGDYSLRDAAQILDRDPAIKTGQNRLGQYLRQVGWIDRRGIPYQNHVDLGRITSRARTYKHPRTGEQMVGEPQVRITVKGLGALHKLLGGTEPLDLDRPALEVVS